MKFTSLLVVLPLVSCVADDLEEGELVDEVNAANGVSLNGVSLNGVSLNGVSLNGASLSGVSIAGVTLSGVGVTNVKVTNSKLSFKKGGATITGAGLVNAQFNGNVSTGGTLVLRLDAFHTLPAPNADLVSYAFSYQTSSGWKPLCGVNDAIASAGTWNAQTTRHQWDSNLFTLSCRGSTFTKCLELGYKTDTVLDTYHQACIRALRADYCGDGTSRTVNGTQVNIYDKLGTQADTQAWALESNWNADGALCIARPRIASTTAAGAPACIVARMVACSTSWGSALIRTEVQ